MDKGSKATDSHEGQSPKGVPIIDLLSGINMLKRNMCSSLTTKLVKRWTKEN